MIIDIHTHIFPEKMRNNRENYFQGENAFKMIYNSPKAQMASYEELLNAMDEDSVDKSVICGFPWSGPDAMKYNNDYCMEAVSRYPDRFIGLGCFDAFSPYAAVETERCLSGNLKGVGELAFYLSGIDDSALTALSPVMNICLEKKGLVLIHTNEPVGHMYPGKTPITLLQIYNMAKQFPDNIIVLAHWGGGIFFYELMKKEVKETLKHVYYDSAASPFLYSPDIYRYATNLAGENKVLFGSDYPLIKPSRYFKEMEASGMSKENQARIKGENAVALFETLGILKSV